jgi:hypothetical protein
MKPRISLRKALADRQSAVVLDYIHAIFSNSLMLSQLVVKRTQRALVLMNRITIVVRSSDFRRIRGATLIAVIADELAFLRSDDASSNPDTEILKEHRARYIGEWLKTEARYLA